MNNLTDDRFLYKITHAFPTHISTPNPSNADIEAIGQNLQCSSAHALYRVQYLHMRGAHTLDERTVRCTKLPCCIYVFVEKVWPHLAHS